MSTHSVASSMAANSAGENACVALHAGDEIDADQHEAEDDVPDINAPRPAPFLAQAARGALTAQSERKARKKDQGLGRVRPSVLTMRKAGERIARHVIHENFHERETAQKIDSIVRKRMEKIFNAQAARQVHAFGKETRMTRPRRAMRAFV